MDKLQYISHSNDTYGIIEGIEGVLKGGCRWIQLRMKDTSTEDIVEVGKQVRRLCDKFGAALILDDHVELVERIGADGVHLGKNDMPVDQARNMLPQHKIVGATANTFEDIVEAVRLGADYIGLGPFRFTSTKQKLSPILGLDGYRDIVSRCRTMGIGIPIVAIGGITLDDVYDIMATGVNAIAVSGAILNASDISLQTNKFLEKLSYE